MAQLQFTAGAITSTITANNTKADTVFTNSAQLLGYKGDLADKQAIANFVMAGIKDALTGWSRQWQELEDIQAARDAVEVDPDLAFED